MPGTILEVKVAVGSTVKKGDLLIEFDPEAIRADGFEIVTPVIVCNTDAFASVSPAADGAVTAGDVLLRIEKK